jgi:hypothetical protein
VYNSAYDSLGFMVAVSILFAPLLIDRNNGDKLLEWRTNNALL